MFEKLDDRPARFPQVSIVVAQHFFVKMMVRLMDALKHFPEARKAVVQAFSDEE